MFSAEAVNNFACVSTVHYNILQAPVFLPISVCNYKNNARLMFWLT